MKPGTARAPAGVLKVWWMLVYVINYAGMVITGPCRALTSEWKNSLDVLPFYQWQWPTHEISQAEQHPSANFACSHYTSVKGHSKSGLKEQIDIEESLPIREATDLLWTIHISSTHFIFKECRSPVCLCPKSKRGCAISCVCGIFTGSLQTLSQTSPSFQITCLCGSY